MKNYDYSKEKIIKALLDVGIRKNDNIFVHSNIGFFGRLKNARTKQDYYNIFKKAIFDVIGKNGTLVVPSFSYSFCKKNIFYLEDTPSVCGFFSEMVRIDPDSIRSRDANFSVCAIGKNSEFFTKNVSSYSFGPDSFWERFLKVGGTFCNFNFDAASTFVHYIERELRVPYRFDKGFPGLFFDGHEKVEKIFYHFCYDLNKPQHAPDFYKFDRRAKLLGFAKVTNLGRGQIVSISSNDTFNLVRDEISKNRNFLIKGDC